jgi:thiol-disulfide isomerase/thioredoxin
MPLRIVLLSLLLCLPILAQATTVKVGDTAPAVDLPNLSGEGNTSLAQLRGKIVYLDFWASWCGPCRVSFPLLEAIRTELKAQGFEILAVNVDEFEEDALEFLEEIPVTYPIVQDVEGASPKTYGILGMPTGFLIDRDGVVRQVHQGFRKSDGEKLRAEILDLLGE